MDSEEFEAMPKSYPPSKPRTPEWEARAESAKERAQEKLDRLYKTHASTSDIRVAEREWEFAHDELKFGPFPDSQT